MRRFRAGWMLVAGLTMIGAAPDGEDPFAWLEDVHGAKAMAWVEEQNAKTTALLEARPEYRPIYDRTLQIERALGARRRAEELAGGKAIEQDATGLWRLEGESIYP